MRQNYWFIFWQIYPKEPPRKYTNVKRDIIPAENLRIVFKYKTCSKKIEIQTKIYLLQKKLNPP